MRLGIMQPYFLPYIGYWQLIHSVDKFVVYNNIKYTKKGWINRNRFLQNGKDADFTIPLKKASDFLNVRDRTISADFNRNKLLNQMKEAYKKAPYFNQIFPIFEKVLYYNECNLFDYIYFSIKEMCNILKIKTEIIISSNISIDHSLKSQDKVVAICKNMGADIYINAIGGQDLYSKETFSKNNIDIKFIKSNPFEYKQFNNEFIQWLSIIDVLMFNSEEEIYKILNSYELI